MHEDAGSDVGKDDDKDSVASGEFVAASKANNAAYKDILFGQRERLQSTEADAKTNYLTHRPYSNNYFKLLEVRKNLPAW